VKRFFTKTGVELKCVNGGGMGNGIPRGKLLLVTPDFIENQNIGWFNAMGNWIFGSNKPAPKNLFDVCPECGSDNISNEDGPIDGEIQITCHDCSSQWQEEA
jgi:hypothetical protein